MQKGGRITNLEYIIITVFVLGVFVAILNYYDNTRLQLSPEMQEVQQVSYEEFETILASEISGGLIIIREGDVTPEGDFVMIGQRIFDPSVQNQYDEMVANIRMFQAQQITYQASMNLNTPFQNTYQVSSEIVEPPLDEVVGVKAECVVSCRMKLKPMCRANYNIYYFVGYSEDCSIGGIHIKKGEDSCWTTDRESSTVQTITYKITSAHTGVSCSKDEDCKNNEDCKKSCEEQLTADYLNPESTNNDADVAQACRDSGGSPAFQKVGEVETYDEACKKKI